MMGSMFTSATRPFYQSVSVMNLGAIAEDKYAAFIKHHFEENERRIADDSIHMIYEMFDGVTWYIQKVMNYAYSMTDKGDDFNSVQLNKVIDAIVEENSEIYKNLLFLLTPVQKQLLIAIGKENIATGITGRLFIKKYSLASASSVQKAVAALQDKQIVTNEQGAYQVYDRFLSIWLRKNSIKRK